MTKKAEKPDAVELEKTVETVKPNEDGFAPGQPVTFEQVMKAQRAQKAKQEAKG